MDYYIDTRQRDFEQLRISGSKGHGDFFYVLGDMGIKCIKIPTLRRVNNITPIGRLTLEYRLRRVWEEALKELESGDKLILHSPPSEKFLGLPGVIRKLKKRGCMICVVIFDTEQFYLPDYKKAAGLKHLLDKRLEAELFRIADVLVVHTDIMRGMLVRKGLDRSRMVIARAWDHLNEEPIDEEKLSLRIRKDKPIVCCGNLAENKAGFLYHLNDDLHIDLYGPGYTGKTTDKIRYRGVYRAEELMDVIEGSYGLVWDGPSDITCTGTYGEYLLYNIPHKLSLYLACGMPAIIWKDAAMSSLITEEGCGLTVGKINEIPALIDSVSDKDYARMQANAIRVGAEMRQGRFIRSFIREALDKMDESEEKGEKTNKDRNALIIFTREPVPGKTKTRLMPVFTPEQCAELHKCFLKDVSKEMKKADADIYVAYTGGKPVFLKKTFRRAFKEGRAFDQLGDDLGERMENAFKYVLGHGYDKAVLIGTDIPEIRAETIEAAFERLDDSDIVMGPTADGGYYLIGMKEARYEAFDVKLYGVGTVFDETLESIRCAGLSVSQVREYSDIDEPGDLAELRDRIVYDKDLRHSETGRFLTRHALISIIIPVYNETGIIDIMTDQLKLFGNDAEIIFVDGGSTDGTLEKLEKAAVDAEKSGTLFRLIRSEKGRGLQLNRGAVESSGDILFFLHCDCRLPEDFISEIRACIAENPYGCFGLSFDSHNFLMLTNRVISNHRAWSRGLPFGDQGIFMDRKLFFDLGMYPDIPFMEDYEFALRARKLGMRPAGTKRRILSSGRRYGKGTLSIAKTELRMWNLRRLYRKGRSAEELSAYYDDVR